MTVTKRHTPKRKSNDKVLGIGRDLSELTMVTSERPLLAVIGGAVLDASITRTVGGASNIQIVVHDPERKLLRNKLLEEKWDIHLDGLQFRYKGASKSGPDITLSFIELNAARLQEVKGVRKAYRDKVTRAEFILSEVREADGPEIPVRIFELHKAQPIKTEKETKKEKEERNTTGEEHTHGEPGLGKADLGKIQVKHVDATIGQIHIIDEVLNVGMSMGASFKLLIASVMVITQETDVANLDNGAAGIGPFSQEPGTWGTSHPGATKDISEDARGFFQVGIKADKAKPAQSKADLCQAVQASGAGASFYAKWEDESTQTVEQYLGGSDVGSVSQTITERYAFERSKKENAWTNAHKLAGEVKWRRFMVAGKFFYVPDTFLMRAKRRAVLDEESSGIDTIDFDMHENVEIHEVTVSCRAQYWKVPPGCVAALSDQMGPAAGNYIVETIEGSLFDSDPNLTIKLHKPVQPLKEPANETKTKSISVGSGSSPEAPAGMPANVVQMLEEAEAIEGSPYLWGAGHESASAVNQRLAKYDCSGAVSRILHVGGYLDEPKTSGNLAGMFESGKGEWFTIYANSVHVWIEFKTNKGWRAWEEGGNLSNHAGWSHEDPSGYSARHPKGT
jgi:hypothetical protein